MSEDKSSKAQKFIAKFMKWVAKVGGDNMLYRGLADKSQKAEASLYRRLGSKNNPASKEKFIQASEELVRQAKLRGYARDPAGEWGDLQLMGRLQHYGAATCLIDFTRNPLVALWFACQPSNQKDDNAKEGNDANGKVIAVNSSDPSEYRIVQLEHLTKYALGDFMNAGCLWKWRPENLENRVIAQHSEFIFGEPTVAPKENIPIPAALKADILQELAKNDISEERLFFDFYGFAQINAHDRPYYRKSARNYAVLAAQEAQSGNYQEAIYWYGVALTKKPGNPNWLNNRGNAHSVLGNYEDAIADYDEAIRINKQYANAYDNRAVTKIRWRDKEGAKAGYSYESADADFQKAKELRKISPKPKKK